MEIKDMVMYVTMTALLIVPIALLARAGSAKARAVRKQFRDSLKQPLHTSDVMGRKGMAIGSNRKKLVYVSLEKEVPEAILVDAVGPIDCQVLVNGSKTTDAQSSVNPQKVTAVDLLLSTGHSFRFFETNTDGPMQANYHYQLARRWKKLLAELPLQK